MTCFHCDGLLPDRLGRFTCSHCDSELIVSLDPESGQVTMRSPGVMSDLSHSHVDMGDWILTDTGDWRAPDYQSKWFPTKEIRQIDLQPRVTPTVENVTRDGDKFGVISGAPSRGSKRPNDYTTGYARSGIDATKIPQSHLNKGFGVWMKGEES